MDDIIARDAKAMDDASAAAESSGQMEDMLKMYQLNVAITQREIAAREFERGNYEILPAGAELDGGVPDGHVEIWRRQQQAETSSGAVQQVVVRVIVPSGSMPDLMAATRALGQLGSVLASEAAHAWNEKSSEEREDLYEAHVAANRELQDAKRRLKSGEITAADYRRCLRQLQPRMLDLRRMRVDPVSFLATPLD